VDNDYAADRDEYGTPPEVFLLRRAAAYQAYFEAMPLRRAQLSQGPALRLYRRLQFGSLIDLSVLDTRQHRSAQACGGGWVTGCAASLDPGRTLLGADQERWLFDNLAAARARWTVVGQQVPTYARDSAGAVPAGWAGQFAMDKWDGYVASTRPAYTIRHPRRVY
jgi:alkaline phosphatase D